MASAGPACLAMAADAILTHEERIDGTNGQKLFLRSWRPAVEAKATVLIVPGFKAHSGCYGWVAEQLVSSSVSVYALDLRGRGRSDGDRFYVNTFDDYEHDVDSALSRIRSHAPPRRPFLLGHSAGGVTACLYALDHPTTLAGLICESFAYALPAPEFALEVLKGLGHLAPHAHVLQLRHPDFSRDPAEVQALEEDPLIACEAEPAQTVAAMVRADERLRRAFARLELPLLILHGTADRAAKASGSEELYARAGSRDKTLKLYEGGFHDLLHDLDKAAVMRDIQGWLAARTPGLLAALH